MPLSKANSKLIQSLKLKKYRQKYNKFLVAGEKIVAEALRDIPARVQMLAGVEEWFADAPVPDAWQGEKHLISDRELVKLSSQKTPNRVLAVLDLGLTPPDAQAVACGLSLYLDRLRDPGNLGTILRIADWFGLSGVFLSPGTVDPYNPKVVQSSMGSLWRVPVAEMSLEEINKQYPDLPIYGTTLEGENVFTTDLPPAACLVIGNESHGMDPDLRPLLSGELKIPAAPGSKAESLNAAVSAAVFVGLWG